ncbi:MAG: TonB-dependent receptor plug domain-containing protein, partial [Flavitalea sp.]
MKNALCMLTAGGKGSDYHATWQRQRFTKKLLRIMKFTSIILLTVCLTASARGISQKVTLSVNDVRLEKIFREIKKQTGFVFFYDEAWLKKANKVSVDISNAGLSETLDKCFQSQPLIYSIVGTTIVVKQKDNKTENIPEAAPLAEITGRVLNEGGEPVVAASISVRGVQRGTITNERGEFRLNANSGDMLVISSVGYLTQEIKVGSQTSFNVSLVKADKSIDEVVVIGYGTQKKSDLTGSVSVVSAKDFEKSPVIDALQALQGKVPGLQITSNSGQPGVSKDIQIRGLQSLGASTTPLYVIDGTITEGITNISPGDIESITVLKDAASAAIYGSRSANGVILVTTKRGGKNRAPVIAFQTYQGIKTESNLKLKLLNASQWTELDKESYENAGIYEQSPYWDLVNGAPADLSV